MVRLAIVASHPVQYYAPIFRTLAGQIELTVYYTQEATQQQQAAAGFGKAFSWDVDLSSGYRSSILRNIAPNPNPSRFTGADTPEIRARLKHGRYDAVLVMGWYLKAHVQAIIAAKRLGIPVLLRGDNQLGTPRSLLKRLARAMALPAILRLFDAICTVGAKNRAYYLHYRYPEARLVHSPHAVDTERFAAGATAAARSALRSRLGAGDTRLVLFAGKLVDFKHPLDAVDMVAILRGNGIDAALIIAGSGPLEETVAARAHAAKVPLHALGFQNQSAMPAAYAAADVLLLPSARETWGLVANEALASGTPIVVSDAAGCAADLCVNDAGRNFPVGDVAAGAAALAQTLLNPPSPTTIHAVSERHSLQVAASGIISAAEAVTGGRS